MRRASFPLGELMAGVAAMALSACGATAADTGYFGKVEAPDGQHLRYVSTEPESLDPQIATAQTDSRIVLALFDGLTEYDPRTAESIPALAERWDVSGANRTFVFHLRPARWSDGTPLTADDVVYSVRRGLDPTLGSRSAYLAYDILHAQGYNERAMFVRDDAGRFLIDPRNPGVRLIVPGDAQERARALDHTTAAAIADQELVPVAAADVGIEALDPATVRIRTTTPVPFLPKLVSHQFFRVVPRHAIEQHGDSWIRPGRAVTSGAFTLQTWKPYDRIVLLRNPAYWDAARVQLERLTFYSLEELTTMMNLYKAGEVDAVGNHTVPASWLAVIDGLRDHMDAPEALSEFYYFNVGRPPMDDLRVRKAFNMAIDKVALARFKRAALPLTGVVPEGIFPGYPHPRGDQFDPTAARDLLAQAGYQDSSGAFDPRRFPVNDVELTYNTSESNRQTAEFVQAQWKQHLGLTIPLRNMEFRTLLSARVRREYRGIVRGAWAADYMDPFSFLNLFSTAGGENGSGWSDPRFAAMLQRANQQADAERRYQELARAEAFLLEAQPIIPLLTTSTNWVKKPYVKGMYPNPLTLHAWKFVWIEHDATRWD